MGRKKHVFVWILVIIILLVLEYFIYSKYVDRHLVDICPKCPTCEKCDEKETEVSDDIDTCEQDIKKMDQALFTGLGMVFISRDGDVYYEPKSYYDPGTVANIENLEEIAKKTFGDAQKYELESSQIFNMELDEKKKTHEIVGYKLDLSNIKNVFYTGYGNSSANYVFAFVSYNGKVSIIKYENGEFSLPKKLSEYANIVSVSKSSSEAGSGLLFIDKCGSKYFYTP